MSLPGRVGKGDTSNNVRLIEWFESDDTPSHLAALCSEKECENLARDFRDGNVPVCFDHAGSRESEKMTPTMRRPALEGKPERMNDDGTFGFGRFSPVDYLMMEVAIIANDLIWRHNPTSDDWPKGREENLDAIRLFQAIKDAKFADAIQRQEYPSNS